MNFVTNLLFNKRSNNVYDAILVIVNYYTKMTLYILVTKKIIAADLVEILFESIILRFEALKEIVFD